MEKTTTQKTQSRYLNRRTYLILSAIIFAIFFFLLSGKAASASPGNWPADSDWQIITGSGVPLGDEENRSTCSDTTIGGAAPGAESDIGSQGVCGPPPPPTTYNPGNTTLQQQHTTHSQQQITTGT